MTPTRRAIFKKSCEPPRAINSIALRAEGWMFRPIYMKHRRTPLCLGRAGSLYNPSNHQQHIGCLLTLSHWVLGKLFAPNFIEVTGQSRRRSKTLPTKPLQCYSGATARFATGSSPIGIQDVYHKVLKTPNMRTLVLRDHRTLQGRSRFLQLPIFHKRQSSKPSPVLTRVGQRENLSQVRQEQRL